MQLKRGQWQWGGLSGSAAMLTQVATQSPLPLAAVFEANYSLCNASHAQR